MNGFYGSAFGNILGTLYFLLFQCVGVLYIKRIFPKKGLLFHLLTGSVSGSVLLQWIPALFAFFFGFSMTAHIMAHVWYCYVTFTILPRQYLRLLPPKTTGSCCAEIMPFFCWQAVPLFCFVFCYPPTPSCRRTTVFMWGSVLMGICRCTWESLQVLPINRPSLLTTPSLPGIGSAILSCATVFLPVFTCLVHPCAMLICSLCILPFSRS